LVKHCDDYQVIFFCVIEERIGKTMKQDPPECAMNDLECQGMFSGYVHRSIESRHEVIGEHRGNLAVPRSSFTDIVLRERSNDDSFDHSD